MSNFPAWWSDTITIYNRYEDPQTNLITWTSNVLTKCFFDNVNNKLTVGQTVIEANKVIVRIPQQDNYMSYADWLFVGNDRRGDYFTLHQGDIIILGDVGDVIDEYDNLNNSNALISRYKEIGECLVVDTFVDNAKMGRGLKHYKVIGE